jgi:PAS domain S-box-containing protein
MRGARMSMRRSFLPAANLVSLIAVGLLCLAVAAAYFGMRQVRETLRVERLGLVQLVGIEGLQGSLQEVEALQREYLITGDPVLVARFETQREKIRRHLAELGARFEDAEQRAAMPELAKVVGDRLDTIELTLEERRKGDAEQAGRLAFTPARIAGAERAEQLLAQVRRRHLGIVAKREGAAAEDLGFLERGLLVGVLLAGALLGWSVRAGARQEAARRAAEAALQDRSRELRLLIDAVPAAIAYVDPGERVRVFNRAFAGQVARTEAQIEGRTLRELLGEAEYAVAGPYIARALAGEMVRYERRQPTEAGAVRDLAVTYLPHRSPAGVVLGYYALLTDITELKNLSRLKSDFVKMVSHELRTPATAIRGALGLLAGGASGALPPDASRLVGVANASCDRLVRLVDDIVDIETIEAGELAVELRDEDLARLVPLALVAAGPLARQRGVRLQSRGDMPAAKVRTDAGRTNQVLTNLLANAIQFSPSGGVVEVGVESRGDRFRVSVRDHGPGVSEILLPRLFEKFAQDPGAARGSTGRFGLGLAISRRLVERLGGEIGYLPASGGGALFWFDLPAAPAVATAEGAS